MRRFALIPAYKPNENLIYFVQSLEKRGIEVVVVDDGSGEEYLPLFSQLEKNSNAKIIRFYINQGKGAALKEGLSYLNNIEGDFAVITLDADGQHSLQDATYLLEKAAKSEDDRKLYYKKGILFFYRSGYRGYSNRYESVQKKSYT